MADSDHPYLAFEASLPQDALMPVKPTRDFSPMTGKRRVRIWLDAFLAPGESELTMLLADETFDVTLRRRPKPSGGSTLGRVEPD